MEVLEKVQLEAGEVEVFTRGRGRQSLSLRSKRSRSCRSKAKCRSWSVKARAGFRMSRLLLLRIKAGQGRSVGLRK